MNADRQTCPECRSDRVRAATRKDDVPMEITLRALRVCDACGAVFEPRSGLASPIIAMAIGCLLGILGVWDIVALKSVFRVMLGVVVVLAGLAIAWNGSLRLRAALARRSQHATDSEGTS